MSFGTDKYERYEDCSRRCGIPFPESRQTQLRNIPIGESFVKDGKLYYNNGDGTAEPAIGPRVNCGDDTSENFSLDTIVKRR